MEFSSANTMTDMRRLLRDVDFSAMTSGQYRLINRQLRAIKDGPEVRIAYLGNVTLDLLPPYVAAHNAREGWRTLSYIGGFAQHYQELHSPKLAEFAPEVIVLILSLPLLREDAISDFTSFSEDQKRSLRDSILDEIEHWVLQATKNSQARLLVANFPLPHSLALGIADTAEQYGESEFYLDLNLQLLRQVRKHPRVSILDINRIAARAGHMKAFDPRLFLLAKMDWTEQFMAIVGNEIARHVIGAKGAARKCLVLDMDNTLWGGVIGEDGINGVRIGHGDAESEAYLAFQRRIKTMKDRGILLAVCSKNNIEDIEELFNTRTEMPLQLSDFSAQAIGWEAKHLGLVNIARQLNIGIDALVFIDDNPAETALVQDQLPEVECILLPPDPACFVATLDSLCSFEKSAILAEDTEKTKQYAAEAARQQFSTNVPDMDDYLHSLQIVVHIRDVCPEDLLRVHQLFSKTNQFNVTTKRYSLGELETFMHAPGHILRITSMRDRFGDLGIIGAYLLIERGPMLHIDSLMMSCRAMGRGVETVMLNDIKQHFMTSPSLETLEATFVPTTKNVPAMNYFSDQGLHNMGTASDSSIIFSLNRDDVALCSCDWITLEQSVPDKLRRSA